MPFSPSDADKHKKGLDQDSKVKWARVANAILEREGDEGKAIRIANSQVKARK